MNQEEIKVKIEVNIGGEHVTLVVPMSRQDAVRETEAEMGLKYQELRERFPMRGQKDLLAMMAYHYASSYFSLVRQHEEETDEAEELLREVRRLNGEVEEEM